MMLTRCGARILFAIFSIILATLFYPEGLRARQWNTQKAAQAFQEARQKRSQIDPSNQPTLGQYLECARTYRKVYLSDPHYRHSGDALYEEGLVYQQMGNKFGNPEHYQTAVKRLSLLVSDYEGNPNCPNALLRMADIYSNSLKDEAEAQKAYQRLRTRYQHSPESLELAPAGKSIKPPPSQENAFLAAPFNSGANALASIESIRHWLGSDSARVTIDLDAATTYKFARLAHPDRIYIDISHAKLSGNLKSRSIALGDDHLSAIRTSQNAPNAVRVVFDVSMIGDYTVSELQDPFRIIVNLEYKREPANNTSVIQQSRQGAMEPPPPSARIAAQSKTAATPQRPSPVHNVEPELPQIAQRETRLVPKAVTEIGRSESAQSAKISSTPSSPAADTQPPGAFSNVSKTVTPEAQREAKLPSPRAQTNEKKASPKASETIRSPQIDERAPQPATSIPVPKESENQRSETVKAPPLSSHDVFINPKAAPPTSHGDHTLTRMLGLKIGRIVLDPGHGGRDLGTIGPKGLCEKDLVLSLALELKALLQEELGAEVYLTRSDDTFITLEERTAIANQHRADLFVSIHANSSSVRSISGVETYYLDFAQTNAEREIAARENATSANTISDLEDLVKKIAQADKSAESRELASIMQMNLFSGARKLFPSAQNRGVRSAPFVVLIGANMPSILAEVAFISNPRDERLLNKKTNQKALAKALFSGIVGYMETLGSKMVYNRVHLTK